MIPSLISAKGCKKDNFFVELNNLDNYPINDLKIDQILQHDKNYIGTYSKDNVLTLKNNQSNIINLQDSTQSGSHWVSYKNLVIKYSFLIHMVLLVYLILLKINIQNINFFVIFIGCNQLILINMKDFVFYL